MKLFIGFLVLTALVAEMSAILHRNRTETDGWFVPTVDGKFFWMTRQQFENEYNFRNERSDLKIEFFLYTQNNPDYPEQLIINDADALARSNFNKENPTWFLVHGWQPDANLGFTVTIRETLMKVGNFNIFYVDWSSAFDYSNYPSSKSSVPTVGRTIASFIDFLNETGDMAFENLTLIGHSLGAHAAGYAGKSVKRGMVKRIVGLDPAGPLFDYSDCNTRLCSTDALFVDSIQTNAKLLGFLEPLGKATYYPNGGTSQPGCLVDLIGICSHARSFIYYAEALMQNTFVTIKCENYEEAIAKKCKGSYGNANMGSPQSHLNEGCYYVPVNDKPLFGTGG